MRPVDQSAEVVPFEHTADGDPVAQAYRHAFGDVDVVGDKYGLPITGIEYQALMLVALDVVRQELHDPAAELDPVAGTVLAEPLITS